MSSNPRPFRSLVNNVCDSRVGKILIPAALPVVLGIIASLLLPKPTIKPSVSMAANVQSSSGSQSPNLSGGQHNVQIIYGPTGTQPPAPSSRAVIRQSSTGDQSPNINGIGGDVDIHYESSPSVTR